jgi:hypothetical protein
MTQALYAHMNNKKIKIKKNVVFSSPGHKGNANQNHTKILPHSC